MFLREPEDQKLKAKWRCDPHRHLRTTAIYRTLTFPFGADRTAAVQARKNSQWLAQYLTKKTGEPVNVDAIVALPG